MPVKDHTINEVSRSHVMKKYHIYLPAPATPPDSFAPMLCGKGFWDIVSADEGTIDLEGHLRLGKSDFACRACVDKITPLDLLAATKL